jgi:predicted metalloprotease with PDZ domain
MFAALLAILTIATPDSGADARLVSLPSTNQPPALRDGLPRAAQPTPVPRKRFFGLGVAFQNRGGAQGIALDQVISGSPADRAGFAAGLVIVEIDGQSTLGRSGEDCTRMVRDVVGAVAIKYYDPLTFKLRTRSLAKDWFFLPN